MRIIITTLLLLASVTTAEAAQKKNWYLRIDNGSGGQAMVFKSKAACEAAGQYFLRIQKEFDMKPQRYKSNIRYSNPRCLNRLPYGYMPPP